MTVTPLYSATPSFSLDGEVDDRLNGLVVSLRVSETTSGLSNAELVAHNAGTVDGGSGYLYFDRSAVDYGTRLTIEAGAGDRGGPIFDGLVSAIRGEFPAEGTPRVGILAEDRGNDLRMTRRTRTFEDQTDAAIIERIASDHGLTPDVVLDGPTHRVVAQLNLSDLAFIRQRAQLLNAEIAIEGDTLSVRRREDRGGEAIVLSYRQNLREFTVTGDLAQQRTGVIVSGWDVSAKEAIESSAGASVVQGELEGLTSGSALLERAFGARAEHLAHLTPSTIEEANAYAEAEFSRMARRFVSGEAVIDGDARVAVGRTVELAGVGPLFDGPYAVVEANHLFDVGLGYRTTLTVERSGVGS